MPLGDRYSTFWRQDDDTIEIKGSCWLLPVLERARVTGQFADLGLVTLNIHPILS